jgi:hypothetical protein
LASEETTNKTIDFKPPAAMDEEHGVAAVADRAPERTKGSVMWLIARRQTGDCDRMAISPTKKVC